MSHRLPAAVPAHAAPAQGSLQLRFRKLHGKAQAFEVDAGVQA